MNKFRIIEGVSVRQLRFISILTPLNAYMRKFQGDSYLLPQASFLGHIFLKEGELLWGDGEDLESCFNLFYLPVEWHVFSLSA